jgi:hypothetical protein
MGRCTDFLWRNSVVAEKRSVSSGDVARHLHPRRDGNFDRFEVKVHRSTMALGTVDLPPKADVSTNRCAPRPWVCPTFRSHSERRGGVEGQVISARTLCLAIRGTCLVSLSGPWSTSRLEFASGQPANQVLPRCRARIALNPCLCWRRAATIAAILGGGCGEIRWESVIVPISRARRLGHSSLLE